MVYPGPMRGLRRYLGILPLIGVLLIVTLAPAAIALGRDAVQPGKPVIIIVPPWDNALRISREAGGRLVAPGRIKSVAMVWSDNPLFTESLYSYGALLVVGSDLSRILCQSE